MGKGNIFAGKAVYAQLTPKLWGFCLIYALGSIFFGYDGASFGGVQAMTPFIHRFGTYSEATQEWAIPSNTVALMNSLPLIGKFVGAVIVGPIIERIGHKWTMILTCIVQCIGPVIQVTSHRPAQFIVGRWLVYAAVGLVENVVPTYQSEIAPPALRGFFVGSIQLCLTAGSLIAGIVNEFMSRRTNDSGWQIATALQAAPAVLILGLVWLTPDSPRWLAWNDRSDDAVQVLKRVRRKDEVDSGLPEIEVSAMRHEGQVGKQQKGTWAQLFNRQNRRRTGIAVVIMILQQLTGVTFSSSYGPTFYRSVGLSDMAFTYAVINNAVSVVTALMAMLAFDTFGRRALVIHGGWSQGAFLISVAALGNMTPHTRNSSNGIVAGMILYNAILHMSLGPAAYITTAEVGTQALREKTMALGTAINVVASFVVVYSTPYILRDIGAGAAYIWGGFAFLTSVWAWFCMPELKGRNLEEVDELFAANIPAWRFEKHVLPNMSPQEIAMESNLKSKEVGDAFHAET